MNNQLQIFNNEQFGQVRTIEENSRILFCGSDVAKALGYAIPTKAVNTHCKGVSKMEVPTNGGTQQMLFITEGDLYRLITHSKLPSAEKFEAWVFDEVLPSIRKTGSYGTTNSDLLLQFISQLPPEQIKFIVDNLTPKLLPIKSSKQILFDFLDTDISILRINFEGYTIVDADLFFEFIAKVGGDKFKVLSDLKNADLVQTNWCGKCVLSEYVNCQPRAVITIKMKPSLKFYECE